MLISHDYGYSKSVIANGALIVFDEFELSTYLELTTISFRNENIRSGMLFDEKAEQFLRCWLSFDFAIERKY